MKNVMKKVFSLLLVGVVAISMFSFITPNRVDAAETNRYRAGKIVISCDPVTRSAERYKVHCEVTYKDAVGYCIMESCKETLNGGESRTYEIRGDVHSISIYTYFDGAEVLPPVQSCYKRVPNAKPRPTGQSILYTIRSPLDPKSPGVSEIVGNDWQGCIYSPGDIYPPED